ncbi:RNA polymerase sigma factor [Streptomyces fulvoviolaceus]|uniref:RNA polymerase sigma factor n=1 Tax=Streptomyces fulvoviolaceus TaxID=285535 RepID=UPI0006934913|nr:RNA polymerase sigma factor [Streptomyces fulvoviolaceus]
MTTYPGCRSCTDPPTGPASGEDDAAPCDSHLVHAMAEGSREAFSELFTRHAGHVFAHLLTRGFPAETAEDAVQEAFLTAWKSASGFHEGNAVGWLLRIAYCRAVDQERAHGRTRAVANRAGDQLSPSSAVAPSAEDCLLASSARYTSLAVALAGLPTRYREVIELRYVHQLSVRQTAQRLGVPENTVKAWAARGCARLREWLLVEGGEEDDDGERRVPRPRP